MCDYLNGIVKGENMDNKTIQRIKKFAIEELQSIYGFCGVIENEDIIILNSGDDIKITIKRT